MKDLPFDEHHFPTVKRTNGRRRKNYGFGNNRKRIWSYTKYSTDEIKTILYANKPSEIIGTFIPLIKRGNGYAGRCPFCRIPNSNPYHFRISDKLRKYKCFECGVGGQHGISFIMRYFNISFSISVCYLQRNFHKNNRLNIKGTVVEKRGNCRSEDAELPW